MKRFAEFFETSHPLGRWGEYVDYKAKQREILTEGLITSYPISHVAAMLSQKYGNIRTYMQVDPIGLKTMNRTIDKISFYVNSSNYSEDLENKIDEDLKLYGYYVSNVEPYQKTEMGLFISPKFSFEIEKKYLKGFQTYHITLNKKVEKILKLGLSPKETNTKFFHDGNRIYVLFSKDENIVKTFSKTLARSKNLKPEDMTILEIDPLPDVEFYIDPDFGEYNGAVGAFTFNSIHPKFLKVAPK